MEQGTRADVWKGLRFALRGLVRRITTFIMRVIYKTWETNPLPVTEGSAERVDKVGGLKRSWFGLYQKSQ